MKKTILISMVIMWPFTTDFCLTILCIQRFLNMLDDKYLLITLKLVATFTEISMPDNSYKWMLVVLYFRLIDEVSESCSSWIGISSRIWKCRQRRSTIRILKRAPT